VVTQRSTARPLTGHPKRGILSSWQTKNKYAPSSYSLQRRVLRNTYMKRTSLKSLFLPCWLLVCFSVMQATVGASVLCIGENGSITVEAGVCSCSLGISDASSVLTDDSSTHHCGPCTDITSISDTYISPRGLRHFSLSFILLTHLLAQDGSQYLASVAAPPAIPSITPSIHPAIRTAVLLI
jgi:hypothetical protein